MEQRAAVCSNLCNCTCTCPISECRLIKSKIIWTTDFRLTFIAFKSNDWISMRRKLPKIFMARSASTIREAEPNDSASRMAILFIRWNLSFHSRHVKEFVRINKWANRPVTRTYFVCVEWHENMVQSEPSATRSSETWMKFEKCRTHVWRIASPSQHPVKCWANRKRLKQ